jgi:hypothetical protein
MPDKYELSNNATVAFETPDTHSHFFGYYDKSPFDAGGDRLLSHRVDFDGRPVKADDEATVGYWRLDDEQFVELGTTRAFNWQQGSMLQWLPPTYDQRIIYNDRQGGEFISVIIDVESGDECILDNPIYAVHPSGEFALGVNYERLYFCRPGYNYPGVNNSKWDRPVHPDDGIYRVDLGSGERTQIISTADVCEIDPKSAFERNDSWLEHAMWNPSGTRFAFFHRWATDDGRFETRLYTANQDGTELFLYPDTGSYSHMDWRDDESFTIWGTEPSSYQESVRGIRDNELLRAVVAPVFRLLRDQVVGSEMNDFLPGNKFLEFTDYSHEFDTLRPDLLDGDGHITWTPNGRWLLADTYTNSEGYRNLFIMDNKQGECYDLGRFASQYRESIYRCDLHPRWDRSYKQVVVDSAHYERRQMIVLDQVVTST